MSLQFATRILNFVTDRPRQSTVLLTRLPLRINNTRTTKMVVRNPRYIDCVRFHSITTAHCAPNYVNIFFSTFNRAREFFDTFRYITGGTKTTTYILRTISSTNHKTQLIVLLHFSTGASTGRTGPEASFFLLFKGSHKCKLLCVIFLCLCRVCIMDWTAVCVIFLSVLFCFFLCRTFSSCVYLCIYVLI